MGSAGVTYDYVVETHQLLFFESSDRPVDKLELILSCSSDVVHSNKLPGVRVDLSIILAHIQGRGEGLRVGAARLYRRLCQLVSTLQSDNGNATGRTRRTSSNINRGKFDQVTVRCESGFGS